MKMSILKIEYKNIRKIDKLELSFRKPDGNPYKTSFVMMANGTGKTTTITLLKALLDGSALNWEPSEVKKYAPQKSCENSNQGEFAVTVMLDNKEYKYFVELASSAECVCGRCIGVAEKETILKNSEKYLGSDQQAVLNTIKSSLLNCEYDNRLSELFCKLHDLIERENVLNNNRMSNEEKLTAAGGEEAEDLKKQIDDLSQDIGACQKHIERIESKDEDDETLDSKNNLYRAKREVDRLEAEIAKATQTNEALRKKEIVFLFLWV